MLFAARAADRPNLIWIMADDLGYGEVGCYGQRLIQTPRLDRMAAEGMRFTQFYAGSTVCAPSRCVLMTGKHLGHCSVRGNGTGPEQALKPGDVTVAEALKKAGYASALIGKWGLGDMRSGCRTGLPQRQGFDYFFGYLNQVHAHNYYPVFLWRNDLQVGLPNVVKTARREYGGFLGGAATKRVAYSHDLFAREALDWIRAHKEEPFFLYLSLTIPHANNEGSALFGNGSEVPDFGPYANKDWPDPDKGHAAMITRMDRDVGRLLDLLRELGLAQRTLVIFTSDNGPHNEARHNIKRFRPSGPLRGIKRDLYEGGIRVPTIAWQPGTVPAGAVSDCVGYFGDLMATACELAGVAPPSGLDSVSLVPALTGHPERQAPHEYLYWEFYERGGARAIRWKNWKAVRPKWHAPLELYDLSRDIGERHNLAAERPELAARLAEMMERAHVDSPEWKASPPPKSSKTSR